MGVGHCVQNSAVSPINNTGGQQPLALPEARGELPVGLACRLQPAYPCADPRPVAPVFLSMQGVRAASQKQGLSCRGAVVPPGRGVIDDLTSAGGEHPPPCGALPAVPAIHHVTSA